MFVIQEEKNNNNKLYNTITLQATQQHLFVVVVCVL